MYEIYYASEHYGDADCFEDIFEHIRDIMSDEETNDIDWVFMDIEIKNASMREVIEIYNYFKKL